MDSAPKPWKKCDASVCAVTERRSGDGGERETREVCTETIHELGLSKGFALKV